MLSPKVDSSPDGDLRLRKSALSTRAYIVLKCMILDQKVAPGSPMSIDELAERLGVSQTPVREALARLEGDGLVIRQTNGRNYTAALLDEVAFEHLYDLRLLLEPEAAARAANGRSAGHFSSLNACLSSMNQSTAKAKSANYVAFVTADAEFHELVARVSGNGFLFDAIHRLHSHHRLAFLYRDRGVTDWRLARSEHEAIARAIVDGDPERARTVMHGHIARSRQFLRRYFADSAPVN